MENSRLKAGKDWLRENGTVVVLFTLVIRFTDAMMMGDTNDYVESIVAFQNGRYYMFWEFGHLVWRPLGWGCTQILYPITQFFVGSDWQANVIATLLIINWFAGLASVLLLLALVRRVCNRRWLANLVVMAFLASQGFLNYVQTGCSYIPGLALLLLGFYILIRGSNQSKRTWPIAILAGLALAGSVLTWFLYVWALPAALVAHLFFNGQSKRNWLLSAQTALVLTVVTAVAYGSVLAHLGIYDLASLKAWISPEGAPPIRGVARMIFGFARSFINMGNDGALLKRFLIHDPFNPISLSQVIRLSLWKLIFFYFFLGVTVIGMVKTQPGRRVLGLLIVSGIPILGFAIVFLGGDLERYLGLYPALFIAVAYVLCRRETWRPVQAVILGFIVVLIINNCYSFSTVVLARQQAKSVTRLGELLPRLRSESRVFAVNWHDDLINFNRSFPFHPINRNPALHLSVVVTPSSPWLLRWKHDFAKTVLETWQNGGDVWLSRRALSPRPQLEWNWVEGDDQRISWTDLYNFFAQFETGATVGGSDGFVLFTRSPKNEQILRQLVDGQPPAK